MQYSLLNLAMNDTCDSVNITHLTINVATLPCEIRNSENVILQWDINKYNCVKYIVYALSKWTCRL